MKRFFKNYNIMNKPEMTNTGLRDRNGRKIFIGDRTRMILPSGEIKEFEVRVKTVIRTILTHPGSPNKQEKVAITGVVFSSDGQDYFPCVDESGVSDTSKMEVIGTIYDDMFDDDEMFVDDDEED